jgi:hypothetical protein
MIIFNIVVRVDNDKDFLLPIFEAITEIKSKGIEVRLNVIGHIYSERVYNKLISYAQTAGISENIFFTKKSIRYLDLSEEFTRGFFINYSLDDVVGYSTIDAMTLGLKTILFNCDPAITGKSTRMSFCNTAEDLINVATKIAENEEEATATIISENKAFTQSFYLNKQESELLLTLF